MEGADIIGRSNLIIDDTPGISIAEMRSKCRKYKLEHNLGIIMIDYLQLMSGSGKSDSRQQEISDISRSLKALARELSVPVIALSQLSRAVEQRPDHRPMLSDLRESGAIEQDADVVMFLYRDDYYHKDTEKKDIAEVTLTNSTKNVRQKSRHPPQNYVYSSVNTCFLLFYYFFMFTNCVYLGSHTSSTVPMGPFLCLAMMISAMSFFSVSL